jgi:ADP-ribose pyrophosphatase YjhB (NUDIX family)
MITHHIQKDIFIRLGKASHLRFSELKPEGMESNLFMYHLKQLIAQKLVEKDAEGYKLAPAGLTYLDSFSFRTNSPRKQPKIISILALKNTAGKWLLARRKYQPYIGEYMFVSGKQRFGEQPETHALREMQEKLGFTTPMTRRGLLDIRISKDDTLITHVLGHVYEATVDMAEPPAETHQFSFIWDDPSNPQLRLLPGTAELYERLLNSRELFFLSLDAQDN